MGLRWNRRLRKGRKSTKSGELEWTFAPEIKKRVDCLVDKLRLDWVVKEDLVVFRSENSRSRAIARIWGLPRVWQIALDEKPKYAIEVIKERFDKLDQKKKDGVLLHELAHIPKTFSGALLPHTRRGKGGFYSKLGRMMKDYESCHFERMKRVRQSGD